MPHLLYINIVVLLIQFRFFQATLLMSSVLTSLNIPHVVHSHAPAPTAEAHSKALAGLDASVMLAKNLYGADLVVYFFCIFSVWI